MSAIARSSFHSAARLLPGQTTDAVRALYAACRQVDDIADAGVHPDPRAALAALHEDLRRGAARSDLARTFLWLHDAHGLTLQPAQDLVAAVAADLDHQPFDRFETLVAYAQGVAGTVGLMMCDVLDVADPSARAQGAALGRAMQFTNIARDVQRDARMGRRYLPASLCRVPPDGLMRPEICASEDVRGAVRVVLENAEDLYASGLRGLPALPATARVGVAMAALTYRDIGRRIAADGYRPPASFAPSGGWRRATLSARAVCVAAMPATAGARHAG